MCINELNVAYPLSHTHTQCMERVRAEKNTTYSTTQYKKNSKLILNLISHRKFMRLAKTTQRTTKNEMQTEMEKDRE